MLELATEKSQFHTVIDCMAEGVMVCNAEQVLVLFNPAALKILSHTQSLNTPVAVSEVLTSEDLVQMISHASTQQKRLSNEVKLNLDTREKWVLANVAPVIDLASPVPWDRYRFARHYRAEAHRRCQSRVHQPGCARTAIAADSRRRLLVGSG